MATSIFAGMSREGYISIAFWPMGMATGPGIHATVNLTADEARELVAAMQLQLAHIPRLGTAADLGCEVLS